MDDAVDDIVRQFKGVSDGLMRKVVGPGSLPVDASTSFAGRTLSFNAAGMSRQASSQNMSETLNSSSDNEGEKDGTHCHKEDAEGANEWHSDNELKFRDESRKSGSEKKHSSEANSVSTGLGGLPVAIVSSSPQFLDDPIGMPPEVSYF